MTDKIVAFPQRGRLGITHRDEVLLLILMSLEFGRSAKERCGIASAASTGARTSCWSG